MLEERFADAFAHSMLEDGSWNSIVRWSLHGDSFIVVVSTPSTLTRTCTQLTSSHLLEHERIHKARPPATFPTLELCFLCPTAEQVRFPQDEKERADVRGAVWDGAWHEQW